MKKFNFQLENVLEYRQNIEDQQKEILGKAMQRVQEINCRLGELALEKDRQGKTQDRTQTIILWQREAHLQYIDSKIYDQEEILAEATRMVAKHRQKLIEASQQRKMIANIKEKRLQEYQRESAKEELNFLNEAGLVLYRRKQANELKL